MDVQNTSKENLDPKWEQLKPKLESSVIPKHESGDELDLKCNICDVVYASKEEYEQHIKTLFHELTMQRASARKSRVKPATKYSLRKNGNARPSSSERRERQDRDRHQWRDEPREQRSYRKQDGDGNPPALIDWQQWNQPYRYQDGYQPQRSYSHGSQNPQQQGWENQGGWYPDSYEQVSSYTAFSENYGLTSSGPSQWHNGSYQFHQSQSFDQNRECSDRSWIEKNQQDFKSGSKGSSSKAPSAKAASREKKRDNKESGGSAEESKDARAAELSLKTSQIIDSVIHGMKPTKTVTSSTSSSSSRPTRSSAAGIGKSPTRESSSRRPTNNDDILSKAEKLVQSFRGQRQAANERKEIERRDKDLDLVSSSVTKHLPNWKKVMNDVASTKPTGISRVTSIKPKTAHSLPIPANMAKAPLSSAHRSALSSNRSHSDTSALSSTNSYKASCSRTNPRKASEDLKDTVIRMLNYPKSRRGLGQVEKLLQKQKVASSSHHRLLTLMQPLSHPENKEVEFSQLAPEVQRHILSLLDEVVDDIDPDDVVLLSDDDVTGFGSPPYISSTPADSGQASFGDTSEIMDIRDHFSDLLQEDPDLSSIMDSDLMTPGTAEPEFSPAVQQGLQIVDRLISDIKSEALANRTSENISKAAAIIEEAKRDVKKTTSVTSDVGNHNSSLSVTVPSSASLRSSSNTSSSTHHLQTPSRRAMESFHQTPTSTHQSELSHHQTSSIEKTPPIDAQPSAHHSPLKIHVINHPMVEIPSSSIIKIEPEDPTMELSDLGNTSTDTVIHVQATAPGSTMLSQSTSHVPQDNQPTQDASDVSKTCGKRSRNSSSTAQDQTMDTDSPAESTASENPKQAKQAKLADESGLVLSPMDELYHISMEEEEIHQKILDTEQIIRELNVILESTKSRLQDREKCRRQLQDKEAGLRKRRIELLRNMTSKKGPASVSSTMSAGQVSDTARDPIPEPGPAEATLPTSADSSAERRSSIEPGHILKMEPDTTEGLLEVQSTSPGTVEGSQERTLPMEVDCGPVGSQQGSMDTLQAITDTMRQWSDSERVSNKASDDEGEGPVRTTHSNEELPEGLPNLSVKYLGSFTQNEGVGNIIRQLATDFKHLKKTSYVLLNENEEMGEPKPETPNAIISDAEVEDLEVLNDSEKLKDSKKKNKKGSQKSPKPNTKSKSAKKTKTSKSVEPHNFKVPEVPETGGLPKAKGTRSKKKQEKPQRQSVSESENDEDISKPKMPKPKKKKGKTKDKGTSKIMKEYLHGSSSTDVEIEGLEPQPLSSINSSQVIDVSDNKSDASSTCSKSSGTIGVRTPFSGLFQQKSRKGCIGNANICSMALCRKSLLVAGSNGTISMYARFKKETILVRNFNCHKSAVPVLYVSPNPVKKKFHQIYSGGADQFLVCMMEHGGDNSEYKCTAPVRCASYGWSKLYLGLADGTIVVFSVQRFHVESAHEVSSKRRAITQLSTAQEGSRRLLCVCEEDNVAIYVRDARTQLFIRALEGHTKPPAAMVVRNHRVYSGGADNMVQVHNLNTGEMETLLRFRSPVTALVIDRQLFVAERRGLVSVIQLKDHMRLKVFYSHDCSPVEALCFDPEHSVLYVGDRNKSVEALITDRPTAPCQYSACREYSFCYPIHLLHHLLQDHLAPLVPARGSHGDSQIRCLWKGCTLTLSSQGMRDHMSEHAARSFYSDVTNI